MPFSNIGAYACQNLQTDLISYFGANAPQFRTLGSTSFIKWLLSPQNTSNFKRIDVTSIPGKKRAVAFRVNDPFCFDLTRASRACGTPAGTISQSPQEIVFDLDIDPYRITDDGDPIALKIDLDDMAQFCTVDDMSWITDQINRTLMRFEEVLDKRLLELLDAAVGEDIDGNTPTQIPLWVVNTLTNTAVINPEAEFAITQIMRDIGVDSQFAAIGGKTIAKLQKYLQWLTADLASVDMSQTIASTPFAFYDRNIDSIAGQDFWYQIPPGAVQLVSWNRYAPGSSVRKTVTDLYTKGTITLPTTGLTVDYNWTFDYQCNIWTFEPLLFADLAIVPAGGCSTPNVNGILKFQDCSGHPVLPECTS
jgi:hypothetical protein